MFSGGTEGSTEDRPFYERERGLGTPTNNEHQQGGSEPQEKKRRQIGKAFASQLEAKAFQNVISGQEISVTNGIIDAFIKTCQRWKLAKEQQITLLGYLENPTFGDSVLQGLIFPGSQDITDRIGYILDISLGLGTLFNDLVSDELAWLNTIREDMNNKSALNLMLMGHMSNLMTVADRVRRERGL